MEIDTTTLPPILRSHGCTGAQASELKASHHFAEPSTGRYSGSYPEAERHSRFDSDLCNQFASACRRGEMPALQCALTSLGKTEGAHDDLPGMRTSSW